MTQNQGTHGVNQTTDKLYINLENHKSFDLRDQHSGFTLLNIVKFKYYTRTFQCNQNWHFQK